MNKYNILVTGGAGYIGTTLLQFLLNKGYNITVYDNLMYGGNQLIQYFQYTNFKFIEGDILDYKKINGILKNYDIVIHLAALVGYGACRKDEDLSYKINHLATKNIVENINKKTLLIFGSTGSNYGKIDGICTEETPLNPLSIYGITKTLAEKEVMKHDNAIAFRFATAFGISPRLRLDLLINELSYQAFTQKYLVIYEKHFMRTFIHVKDIAKAFLFAIDNKDKMKGEVYNIGSNNMNFSKEDVCELIKSKTNCYNHYADYDGDVDKRDYIVSYDKINRLGFNTSITIDEGIDELIKVFPVINLKTPYKNI